MSFLRLNNLEPHACCCKTAPHDNFCEGQGLRSVLGRHASSRARAAVARPDPPRCRAPPVVERLESRHSSRVQCVRDPAQPPGDACHATPGRGRRAQASGKVKTSPARACAPLAPCRIGLLWESVWAARCQLFYGVALDCPTCSLLRPGRAPRFPCELLRKLLRKKMPPPRLRSPTNTLSQMRRRRVCKCSAADHPPRWQGPRGDHPRRQQEAPHIRTRSYTIH